VALPTVVAVGTVASGTTTATPGLPAGLAADDVMVMLVETQNQTVTPPAGWALITGTQVIVATGTVTQLAALWRRAVAGDSAPVLTGTTDHVVARIIAVRGCASNGNPWNITASATELVADTTVSIPGATTTVDDCLILAAFSTGTDVASTTHATAWTNASLGSVTEQMDNWVVDGGGGGFGMATGTKVAKGAYTATTATVTTANFKALISIALQAPTPPKGLVNQRSPRPSEQPNVAGPYAQLSSTSQTLTGG
jgi:hypothetical protein